MFFGEFDVVDDDGFCGEFGGDLVFGAAEDEWGDAAVEGDLGVFGFLFFDGSADARVEGFFITEEAGHEDAHEAPEFAEVVFHGGSGEAEAVCGFEFAGGLGDDGFGVFDVLGFVEDDGVEVVFFEFGDVAREEGVGCEDDVGGGDAVEVSGAVLAVEC